MNTMPSDEDTIVAISTPLGEGGIGVVRLSGGGAIAIADRIFEAGNGRPVRDQKSFTARVGRVVSRNAAAGHVIDEALLLLMRAPKSYTREDVVELSVHGGPAVLKAVLDTAVAEGARPALPGEFTKRAFLNGRIDLLQAEAVLNLIEAKTELSRKWASAQLDGILSRKMQEIKDGLVGALSGLEAAVDFPDDFLEPPALHRMADELGLLAERIRTILESADLGIIAKRGLRVVITGRPNVGKSSLMNLLAKVNRVIVTPYPGTTRDVVEEEIQIHGLPVRISDTAGIQETAHPIEREGIERSKKALLQAELVLFVVDASRPWEAADQEIFESLKGKRAIVVMNKTDLPKKISLTALREKGAGRTTVEISCLNEEGIQKLEDEIFKFVSGGRQVPEEAVVHSVRQKELLEKTLAAVKQAKKACADNLSPEFIAVDVRTALSHLGALVGEAVTDDVLDALFNRFCVGK